MSIVVEVHGKQGFTPVQAEPGSAGYDLHAPEDIYLPFNCRKIIDTGVIVKTPETLFLLVVPRSSTGTKRAKSVRFANTVGIIDPSYQGQNDTIKICLERGDRRMDYVGALQCDTLSQAHKEVYESFPQLVDMLYSIEKAGDVYEVYAEDVVGKRTPIFEKGDRFAQLLFIPFERPDLLAASLGQFDVTGRGGIGSTGK